jgi:hypothetical protein
MGIEGKKERALVDEVMARIAHESDAIEYPSADELSDDDRSVQCQGKVQTAAEMFIGGKSSHPY